MTNRTLPDAGTADTEAKWQAVISQSKQEARNFVSGNFQTERVENDLMLVLCPSTIKDETERLLGQADGNKGLVVS